MNNTKRKIAIAGTLCYLTLGAAGAFNTVSELKDYLSTGSLENEKTTFAGNDRTTITWYHDKDKKPRLTELVIEDKYICLNDLFRGEGEFYFFSEELDLPLLEFKAYGTHRETRICLNRR